MGKENLSGADKKILEGLQNGLSIDEIVEITGLRYGNVQRRIFLFKMMEYEFPEKDKNKIILEMLERECAVEEIAKELGTSIDKIVQRINTMRNSGISIPRYNIYSGNYTETSDKEKIIR